LGSGKTPVFFFSFSGRVRTGSKTKVRLGTCADAAAIWTELDLSGMAGKFLFAGCNYLFAIWHHTHTHTLPGISRRDCFLFL